MTNQHRGRAEFKREWFEECGTEGLIMLSGAMAGDVGMACLQGNLSLASDLAGKWQALFPDRFYLEVQRVTSTVNHQKSQQEDYIQHVRTLANTLNLPIVATHPIQFITPDDFRAHEARTCISEGYVLADTRRPKHFTEEQYFKTQANLADLFADMPEALANSCLLYTSPSPRDS